MQKIKILLAFFVNLEGQKAQSIKCIDYYLAAESCQLD